MTILNPQNRTCLIQMVWGGEAPPVPLPPLATALVIGTQKGVLKHLSVYHHEPLMSGVSQEKAANE